jgi:adenylate cyclase
MTPRTAFIFLIAVFYSGLLLAQSVGTMETQLRRSNSKEERMNLSFQIARASLTGNPSKAAEYALRANQLAVELGQKRMEADAISLAAEANYRRRNYGEAAKHYTQTWNTARNYGLRDVALDAADHLRDIGERQNNLREALKWSREAINYLKDNQTGRSGPGDAARRIETQLRAAEADNRKLREQLAQATGQTELLETTYRETEAQLKEVQEKSQLELSKREQELNKVSQRSDSITRRFNREVETLTKEQIAARLVQAQQQEEIEKQKRELAETQLTVQENENVRNILALLSGFILLLAGLFYTRYRAKRRTADELSEKNRMVEAEQKRSENLLLNILPPAIAEELKTRNKVAARKYDQATVMFVDFKGFTQIAERLSPETLVEELDFCFSNFDRITEQYRIEKIKTIGDAYLCASGLSDMNASPSDLIKAALEMQDFLLHHQAERQGRGLQYFEARIGVHTGPVVAGVVGAKKFAYDIWGDTVNVAARLQEACEPGRVNVSEDTYQLARYEFEWRYRGKIEAKHKGALDMYYVVAVKQY